MSEGSYARSSGMQVLDALRAQGKRIFTTDDAIRIAGELSVRPTTLRWVLYELVRSGWIRRVRRGLYSIDETDRGGPAPHPFAIATALVEPSAISHWSAMAYHGLTEQVPQIITASTPKDVVTPQMRHPGAKYGPANVWAVNHLSIRYIHVTGEHFWGIEHIWVDEFSRVPITDRERTVLDGFVSFHIFGSIREVLGTLEEHIHEINVPHLIAYALKYGQDTTIKRIGYILDQLHVPSEQLAPLAHARKPGYRLLDPQGPNRGRYISDWQIRDNIGNVEWEAPNP